MSPVCLKKCRGRIIDHGNSFTKVKSNTFLAVDFAFQGDSMDS